MSVDTYLRGKNTSRYRRLDREGVTILVAPSLARWAESVAVGVSRFLLWRSFDVIVGRRHGPT